VGFTVLSRYSSFFDGFLTHHVGTFVASMSGGCFLHHLYPRGSSRVAHILVVSTKESKSNAMVNLLEASGHRVVFARDFDAATKALLEQTPDLVIADVRLDAYNGLHLAARCQSDYPTTSMILLDTRDDAITRMEARRLRATYLVEPVEDADLVAHVSRATVVAQAPHRRWPRKHPAVTLVAQVAERPARLLDLSYGGFRIEIPGGDQLPSGFEVALPSFGVAIRAKPVWTRHAPSGSVWCGAELSDSDIPSIIVWRQIVDTVAAQA
jgi:CheY-like chemotaxis protein